MPEIADSDAKTRDARSKEMGDPGDSDAAVDALGPPQADPNTVAAREAIRAPVWTREGSVLKPGEGWGRNMTTKPTGDWHGTRDGKGCKGVPLDESDPARGIVKGQCPDCGAKFRQEEVPVAIVVDPKHEVQKSREKQRQEISRQCLAKMIKKHGVTDETRAAALKDPDFIAEYDKLVLREYKSASL